KKPAHEIDVVRGKQPRTGCLTCPADVLGGDDDGIVLPRVACDGHTNLTRRDRFVRRMVGGKPAMVERHLDLAVLLVRQAQQDVCLLDVRREWLLDEDVTAALERGVRELE